MELTDNPWLNIRAMMLFPDKDAAYRQAWVGTVSGGPNCDDVTLMQDIYERVSLNEMARRRQEQGKIIGAELGILFLANWHSGGNYLSASKVQQLMREHDSSVPSVSTFTKHHKRYAKVLHLWAADFLAENSINFMDDLLLISGEVLEFTSSYCHKQSSIPLQVAQDAIVFTFPQK